MEPSDTEPALAATTWIQLHGSGNVGVPFYPLAPKVDSIQIETIAHGLSLETRFASHTEDGYQVGMHCYVGSMLFTFDHEAALWFAFHDASEALGLRDLPAPIKHLPQMAWYRQVEHGVMTAVAARFNLDPDFWEKPAVKAMDRRMLHEEQRARLQIPPTGYEWGFWLDRFQSGRAGAPTFTARQVKRLWLTRVAELFAKTGRRQHALEAYEALAADVAAELTPPEYG